MIGILENRLSADEQSKAAVTAWPWLMPLSKRVAGNRGSRSSATVPVSAYQQASGTLEDGRWPCEASQPAM